MKKNKRFEVSKNIYNIKGMTLIALIVTIIVLIILAGVSISLVLGNNGIVKKAVKAKINTEVSSIEEQLEMFVAKEEEKKYFFGSIGDILRNKWSI